MDLADKENHEIEIIGRYLPELISTEEIQKSITAAIERTNAKSISDMGKVMGIL